MNSPKSDICIYCQERPSDSADHVPPKLIFEFERPRPHDLRTVPSCFECNRSFSQDDEYLRLYLTQRQESEAHQSSKFLSEKSVRAIMRSKAAQQRFLEMNRWVPRIRIDGTEDYILQFKPDRDSLERTARRIAKGLLFFHREILLPPDRSIRVNLDFGLNDESRFQYDKVITDFLANEPVYTVASVFEYRFGVANDGLTSAWRIGFLSQIVFWVWTNVSDDNVNLVREIDSP